MTKIATPTKKSLEKAIALSKSLAWEHPLKDDAETLRSFLHGQAMLSREGVQETFPSRESILEWEESWDYWITGEISPDQWTDTRTLAELSEEERNLEPF